MTYYSQFADGPSGCRASSATRNTRKLGNDIEQTPLDRVIFLIQVLKQVRTYFKVEGVGSSLGKQPFSPRSSPLGTFLEEELLQLSDRNSKLMT